MTCKLICPNCSTDKYLVVASNLMCMQPGPEGPTHVIRCLTCKKEIHSLRLPDNFVAKEVTADV